jgi:hypothetical protein
MYILVCISPRVFGTFGRGARSAYLHCVCRTRRRAGRGASTTGGLRTRHGSVWVAARTPTGRRAHSHCAVRCISGGRVRVNKACLTSDGGNRAASIAAAPASRPAFCSGTRCGRREGAPRSQAAQGGRSSATLPLPPRLRQASELPERGRRDAPASERCSYHLPTSGCTAYAVRSTQHLQPARGWRA